MPILSVDYDKTAEIQMNMNTDKKIAAFFDFDETLVTVNSAAMGLRWLWDHKLLPWGYIVKLAIAKSLYERHWISEAQMAKISLTFYKGRKLDDFYDTAQMFYDEYLKPHLAPNVLSRLEHHRQQGHLTVLVSGSLRYYLLPVVEDLKFDHIICSELEEDQNGLLTGRAKNGINVGETKLKNTIKFCHDHQIDMTQSYAYGNHQADIPLLASVGHPVAVSPTEPLLKTAREKDWEVMDEKGL